jgi:hypothetical protein
MSAYLEWTIRQLHILVFAPTQAGRDTHHHARRGGHRARSLGYTFKFLPFIVVTVAVGVIIGGQICITSGISYRWASSSLGASVAVAAGLIISLEVDIVDDFVRRASTRLMFVAWFGVVGGIFAGLAGSGDANASGIVILDTAVGMAGGMIAGRTWRGAEGVNAEILGAGVTLSITCSLFGLVIVLPSAWLGNRAITYDTVSGAIKTASVFSVIAFWLTYLRLVAYPLEALLSVISYLMFRWQPGAAMRSWQVCPVSWNEEICLPLPFVGKLLVTLLRKDRKEGFRQIAFVAAERPLQRRAAFTALADVAIGDLKAKSLAEFTTIAERLNWTTDAQGGEFLTELTTALPRFDRTAQHVGQYLTLHSIYRKGEALTRAVEEMGLLQRGLIAVGGRLTPRLLQVAGEWVALLEAERSSFKRLSETSGEIPNPFRFGNPVTETEYNFFTGRRDIVRQIEASLLGAEQLPTLLLQGARRMGKTSILNQLPRLLGPDFAPAVIDCQNPAVTGSEATLLRYLSRTLSEGLRRRRVQVEALAAAQLAREPYAVFDEWLEKVERAMPVGMRALLCLDEYERLQWALEAGWGAAFLDALRHTFQHRPRVVLMFTGAHTFQELGAAWTDRFVSARRMRVSFLTRADVELLLTKPIPEFDMTYAAGALDTLIAATSCHPFLTQAVAFELVQLLNESQRREATPEDVEEAIGRALASGEAYFANVWGDAGAEGQAILSALASGRTPPELPVADAWLREHDVVGADGDFAVEMLRRWVASRAAGV